MEKTLEEKCIWKEVKIGPKVKKCKKCDGYNSQCEYYLTNEMISDAEDKVADTELEY
jgi:hypothetical protein